MCRHYCLIQHLYHCHSNVQMVCVLFMTYETDENTEDKKHVNIISTCIGMCPNSLAFLFQLKPCKHATGILKQNTVYNVQNLLWINILKLRNRSHLNEYSKLLYKATWNHIKLLSLVYHSSYIKQRNDLDPHLGLCYLRSSILFLTAKNIFFCFCQQVHCLLTHFHKN